MSQECKYIYGVIGGESVAGLPHLTGVGAESVYAVLYQALAAAVSDTALDEVDPTRQNVLSHTVVQDEILKRGSLLPMQFGTVAAGREEVVKFLEKNYAVLTRELARLSGKVEVELKVFWDTDAMGRELQGGSQELRRLKARIGSASSPVEVQNMLVEAGRLVERSALDWKARYAEKVYAVLRRQSLDSRTNSLLGVKNILNASFLVDRTAESDFQAEVRRLDAQYQGKLNFKYVAPLPPYSFVDLKLEVVA